MHNQLYTSLVLFRLPLIYNNDLTMQSLENRDVTQYTADVFGCSVSIGYLSLVITLTVDQINKADSKYICGMTKMTGTTGIIIKTKSQSIVFETNFLRVFQFQLSFRGHLYQGCLFKAPMSASNLLSI